MNGWQRIGIVLSLVWAVGAHVYVMNQEDWASRSYHFCLSLGRDNIREKWAVECRQQFERELPVALRARRENALVAAFSPVVSGWLGVCILIGVLRWIWRGFKTVEAAE